MLKTGVRMKVNKHRGLISHTSGRYWYKDGVIYDKFKDEIIQANVHDGLYYLPDLDGIFSKGISLEFAFCYSYWPFKGTRDEFEKVTIITDGSGDLSPVSISPYYHIESAIYKGHRVIPKFSNYLINENGKSVINALNGDRLYSHFNTLKSRFEIRLKSDDGSDNLQMLYRLIAFSWLEHRFEDLKKDVDHIDEHRVNDHYSNLQFLTRSENATKNLLQRKSSDKKFYVVDLDDELFSRQTFTTLKETAEFCDVRSSAIIKNINACKKYPIIANRFVVWEPTKNLVPNIAECLINRFSSHSVKGFSVIAENVKTGETRRFNKVSEILDNPIFEVTKKTLTRDLKTNGKRVFNCGWFFVYEFNRNRK